MSQKDIDRYMAAGHAMQSGVAMEQNYKAETSKDLRVGVNSRAVDHAALVTLLMQKGVFTLDEYHSALADAMEAEKARYEARLAETLGTKITLA